MSLRGRAADRVWLFVLRRAGRSLEYRWSRYIGGVTPAVLEDGPR